MSRRSASRSAAAKAATVPLVSGFPSMSVEREVRASLAPSAESHYRSLFDGVPVGLYRTTISGQIVDVNPVLVEMLGYPDRAALLAANAADLYVDAEDRRRSVEMLQRDGVLRDFEMRLFRYDGSTIWMRDNVRAICDEEDHPLYFLGSLEDISHRKQAAEDAVRSLAKLQLAMVGTIEAMAAISEMRDPYTAGHQRRVAKLAVAMATRLGLEPEQAEGLRLAALIHDIGKIYVPAEILSKPGRLTEIEFNLIRVHPEVGYEVLKRIDFPWPLAQIVLQHHEHIDGSGYPHGAEGAEILFEARILAVADVVEAMASHRPYRPSLGLDRALREVTTHRGRYYDPDVVDACQSVLAAGFEFEELPRHSRPPPRSNGR